MATNQYFGENKPLISVLLPVGNFNAFFREAVNSVLNQTYSHFEVLVLANGVSDDDFERILEVVRGDERVRVIRLHLSGLVFALNYGLEHAQGLLLARMDADDVSDLFRFERQVNFLENNPDYDVVGGRVQLIDEEGRVINSQFKYYKESEDICKVLPYRNPLCHPGLMFRKDSILKIGGYKFGFMSEDHEMFIRLMLAGANFYNIDAIVLSYRRHAAQVTDFSKASRHFSEISAFMWMYFWNTKRVGFLIGAIAVFPAVRRLRHILNGIRRRK